MSGYGQNKDNIHEYGLDNRLPALVPSPLPRRAARAHTRVSRARPQCPLCLTASHRAGVEEEEDAASVRPAARAVGRIVRRAFRTDGERELALQQYAEQLLNHVVGKLRIPDFLRECFPARLSGKKEEEKGTASARGTDRRRRRRRR